MSPSPSPGAPASSPRRRRLRRWLSLALAVLAGVGVVAWLTARQPLSSPKPDRTVSSSLGAPTPPPLLPKTPVPASSVVSMPAAAPKPPPPSLYAKESAEMRRYRLTLIDACAALARGARDRAADLLDGCDLAHRRWEWYALRRLCAETPAALVLGSTDAPVRGVLSADLRRAAVLYNPSQPHTSLHVFNTTTGRAEFEVPSPPEAHKTGPQTQPDADLQLDTIALSPNARRLALCAHDVVTTRVVPTRRPVLVQDDFGREGVVYVEDTQQVQDRLIGGMFSLDLLTGQMLDKMDSGASSAAFSPDGALLAHGQEFVCVVRDGNQILRLFGGGGQATALAFSPDGDRLAAGFDRGVLVWDVKTGKQIGPMLRVEAAGVGIALEPGDGGLRVQSLMPGGAADKAAPHGEIRPGDRIIAVSRPDGTTASLDGATINDFVRLGRGRVGERVRVSFRRGDATRDVEMVRSALNITGVARVVFSPDGRRLAVDVAGSVAVWELGDKIEATRAAVVHGVPWGLAFSPDGRLLAGHDGGAVTVIDAEDGRELCDFPSLGGAVVDLACAYDGRLAMLTRVGRDLRCSLLDVTALDDVPARSDATGGDRRQAIRDLSAAIEAAKGKDAPILARLYHERGLLLSEEGDFAAAKGDLDRAFELDPSLKDAPR